MTKTNLEAMAVEIYNWCTKKGLWQDAIIYFEGKAWSTNPKWGEEEGREIDVNLYEYADKNPCDYFEYGNPETLSMSFEGPLYEVLNAYVEGWARLEEEFNDIFQRHGFYPEMGYSWSLSACEL